MHHDMRLIQNAKASIKNNTNCLDLRNKITHLIDKNVQWRHQQCINLVAAESRLSPTAQDMLSSSIGQYTAGGYIGKKNRYFVGNDYIDEMESYLFALLCDLFDCNQVEYRLLGGTQACQTVYALLCKPNDTIITVPEHMGGDSSNTAQSMPGYLNLSIIDMPFLDDNFTIDLIKLEELITQHKPRLISLGFATALYQHPVKAIKKLCRKTNTLIYYDAAHELGLIAGKQFPNPLTEGADVMSGSTGKSFSGPQGGILLWNSNDQNQILEHGIFPSFIGTYPLNRTAALCITACELQMFASLYIKAMLDNAKALANALNNFGIKISYNKKEFTQTHHVLINTDPLTGKEAAEKLKEINIICSATQLPGKLKTGIRLGTASITRQGMKPKQMNTIAQYIYECFNNQKPSNHLKIMCEKLQNQFQSIGYC